MDIQTLFIQPVWDSPFSVLTCHRSKFLEFLIVSIIAYSADPDEMLHYASFHLDFHCSLSGP